MLKLTFTASTNGAGHWTKVQKTVNCTGLALGVLDPDMEYGELIVYFTRGSWNNGSFNLIYTDPMFLQHVKIALQDFGFSKQAVKSLSYSTHGWQGDNFVSFDIGRDAVAEALFNGVPVVNL